MPIRVAFLYLLPKQREGKGREREGRGEEGEKRREGGREGWTD